ncbi:hypothetical protein JOF53_003600 [Crossiella equi]|uniref:Uncharacterized protein n=1 Tax=Crossiella equi TaxID=130796 RepID=A0ABS5ADR4_9PSEU|nr:hypothetical protein [Crossiella equi]MBP2474728.1 hypothetical protein [Crossiella equi]
MTATQAAVGLAVLLALTLVWRAGARRAKASATAARPRGRLVSLAGRVVTNAALIVIAQWAVITYGQNRWLLLAALAGPALLASYTLTSALTVTAIEVPRNRGGHR